MSATRRVVLDVLKPHDPPLERFASQVADAKSVEGVTASLIERDEEVQNVEVTVEGSDLDYAAVEARVEDLGGSVHSVDQVACGERVVTERPTPQDG